LRGAARLYLGFAAPTPPFSPLFFILADVFFGKVIFFGITPLHRKHVKLFFALRFFAFTLFFFCETRAPDPFKLRADESRCDFCVVRILLVYPRAIACFYPPLRSKLSLLHGADFFSSSYSIIYVGPTPLFAFFPGI